jgi:hypothetical protein
MSSGETLNFCRAPSWPGGPRLKKEQDVHLFERKEVGKKDVDARHKAGHDEQERS